jgi:hypothetical protein
MNLQGTARYIESANELEVVRPGEVHSRRIRCVNLDPNEVNVFGVRVEGDEIRVLAGPTNNQRPDRTYLYRFSSLTGGSRHSL